MNPNGFLFRYQRHIKGVFAILIVLGFYGLYVKVPPVSGVIDAALTPVVSGVTQFYGKFSTFVYQKTGTNLGFVRATEDDEFNFQVLLAEYVRNKEAAPLVRIAVDSSYPRERRVAALESLLKFEDVEDWITPFINELYKGGMVGLYEKDFPPLEKLMDRVRSEGGIQNSLVRAYAEIALSFMVQVPEEPVVREKSIRWLNDLIAEDALFLMVPRIREEEDPDVRKTIENQLIKVRAVSDRARAREELIPLFRDPPWPQVKPALAVVLARTGWGVGGRYLRKSVDLDLYTDEEAGFIRVAMAETPYPRNLSITKAAETRRAQWELAREKQYEMALAKQKVIEKEQAELARIEAERERAALAQAQKEKEAQLAAAKKKEKEAKKKPEGMLAKKPEPKPDVQPKPVPEKKPDIQVAKVEPRPEPTPPPVPKPEPKVDPVPEPLPSEVRDEQRKRKMAQRKALGIQKTGYIKAQVSANLQDLPLYQAPGFESRPMGTLIKKGAKGMATYRTLDKGRAWFYVKSGKAAGWTPGFLLTITAIPKEPTKPAKKGIHFDTTFFKPLTHNAPIYEKPTVKSPIVRRLDGNAGYLATKFQAEGNDRWFLIQFDEKTSGWARGIDLQLADLSEVSKVAVPTLE